MRSCFLLIALVAAATLPASVRAAPLKLAWTAPSGCPDEAAARVMIERTSEGTHHDETRAVRAEIERQDDGYRLELTIEFANGASHKSLFAHRCETFVELIALELALSALPAEAAQQAQSGSARSVGSARRAPAHVGWGGRLAIGAGSGSAPRPAAGLVIAGALLWQRLRLELGARYDLPRTVRYGSPPGVGGRIDVIAGLVRACHGLVLGPLELPLCLGAAVGTMRGAGQGVALTQREQRPWAALELVPALRFPRTGRWGAWVELGASLALLRPRFVVRNLGTLYRPDFVAVRGAAGIAVQFD